MNTERSGEWGSRRQIHVLALMAVTALGLYLCSRMVLPFVPALTWALALAVLFMPVQRWLESMVKHPNLAASVCVVGIGLIVGFLHAVRQGIQFLRKDLNGLLDFFA